MGGAKAVYAEALSQVPQPKMDDTANISVYYLHFRHRHSSMGGIDKCYEAGDWKSILAGIKRREVTE